MTTAAPRVDDRLFALCGLSWAAGLIHVAAAVGHLGEYELYAVFFELLALVQLGWGVALYRSPSQALQRRGAIINVLVVGLWVMTRTAGLPIGPQPWRPEAVGLLDVLASADEATLALLVLTPARGPGRGLGMGAAACLVLVSSLALTSGHVH